MKVLVFNGWAAGPEAWDLCTFPHDWVFDYLEQLDGLPEKVLSETDDAILVGFSMGGSGALRMTLKYPEKIRGLVLVSATPRMMEDKATDWRGMSERRLAALKLGTQLVFRNDPSPIYREDNLDRGLVYLRETDLRAELAARGGRETLDERREEGTGGERTGGERTVDERRETNFPVRIFQSERDGIVRPDNAEFLKTVFPQATVTMVPGAEHVLPVTVPEMIDAAVFDIIAAYESQTADPHVRVAPHGCAFR